MCVCKHECVHVNWGKAIAGGDCGEVAGVTVYLAFLKPGCHSGDHLSIVTQPVAVCTTVSGRDGHAVESGAPV